MKEADKQAAIEGAKKTLSRKGFLLGGAGVLGASALLGAVPGMASAQQRNIDQLILNYALTLEHLEAQFYTEGVRRYARTFNRPTLKALNRIRKHENNHVKFLSSVIEQVYGNGQDVPRLKYNFNRTAFTSRGRFLEVASLLENTGVSAYDGAIGYITTPGYLTAGATIATVEARHATYVDSLIGKPPFPAPYDPPVAPREVATTVRDTFVTSNPNSGRYGPYRNFNAFLRMLPNGVNPDSGSQRMVENLQKESTE